MFSDKKKYLISFYSVSFDGHDSFFLINLFNKVQDMLLSAHNRLKCDEQNTVCIDVASIV